MITIKKMLAFGVLLASLAVGAKPASAASIVLNFEGLQNAEAVQNFYNGGVGSLGSSGTNYGVAFISGSRALIDQDAGGSGNFANEPSSSTALFFLEQTAIMNVAAGFTDGFSFWYSSVSRAGLVRVYDGLGATGNLLASVNLPALGGICQGDPSGAFCNWSAIGVTFGGTARSVDFGGSANFIVFDDVTLGSVRAGVADVVATPEPGTLLLLGSGIALAVARLRRRD